MAVRWEEGGEGVLFQNISFSLLCVGLTQQFKLETHDFTCLYITLAMDPSFFFFFFEKRVQVMTSQNEVLPEFSYSGARILIQCSPVLIIVSAPVLFSSMFPS